LLSENNAVAYLDSFSPHNDKLVRPLHEEASKFVAKHLLDFVLKLEAVLKANCDAAHGWAHCAAYRLLDHDADAHRIHRRLNPTLFPLATANRYGVQNELLAPPIRRKRNQEEASEDAVPTQERKGFIRQDKGAH
jgi:hypothetical protein